ncbi:hypothetical protein C8Q77DRAFT_1056744 [Trametes polyzona]|nr:hypothetical protein C8Q77DRAFT_1056744 [Trametes polyzona]
MRILSIIPNTAASERTFSQMGSIHNKWRSRLKTERVRKTVMVKDAVHRQYPQPPSKLKRPRHDCHSANSDTDCVGSDSSDSDVEELGVQGQRGAATGGQSSSRILSFGGNLESCSFSAIIDDMVEAATRDAEATAMSLMDDSPDTDPQMSHQEGLLLRNIFVYDSDTFLRAGQQVWARGKRVLDSELVRRDSRA